MGEKSLASAVAMGLAVRRGAFLEHGFTTP
jgi:hypothetical protein